MTVHLTNEQKLALSCSHPICNGKKKVPSRIMKKWKQEVEKAMKEGRIYDSVDTMFKDILAEKDDAAN